MLEFLLGLLGPDDREDLRTCVEGFVAESPRTSDGQGLHGAKQAGEEAADAVSRLHVDCQRTRV